MKENFFLMNDVFPKNLLHSIYDYNSNEKDLYQVRCRRRIYLKIGCFTEAKNFLVKRFAGNFQVLGKYSQFLAR